jgi:glycine cleavage system H lipoate-binding protein
MTALIVLMIFGFFLTLDYLRHRKTEEAALAAAPAAEPGAFVPEPVWVAGYQMPEEMYYHRGHTWVRPTGPDTAVIGLDDFARRLVGPAGSVDLPAAGTWMRQGEKAVRLGLADRKDSAVELVTPIEGEVIETNPMMEGQPGLATSEPYGRGWLMKVRSSELGRNLNNLLSGSLARRFMEDSRERLQHQLMALSGTVLADGGEPAADFARHLPAEDWRSLVNDHLLS